MGDLATALEGHDAAGGRARPVRALLPPVVHALHGQQPDVVGTYFLQIETNTKINGIGRAVRRRREPVRAARRPRRRHADERRCASTAAAASASTPTAPPRTPPSTSPGCCPGRRAARSCSASSTSATPRRRARSPCCRRAESNVGAARSRAARSPRHRATRPDRRGVRSVPTDAGCQDHNVSSANYNGQWIQVRIPIPNDYSCNYTDPLGCWLRVNFAFPAAVQDTTTWTAQLTGRPGPAHPVGARTGVTPWRMPEGTAGGPEARQCETGHWGRLTPSRRRRVRCHPARGTCAGRCERLWRGDTITLRGHRAQEKGDPVVGRRTGSRGPPPGSAASGTARGTGVATVVRAGRDRLRHRSDVCRHRRRLRGRASVMVVCRHLDLAHPGFALPIVRLDVGASLLASVTAAACFLRWRLEGTVFGVLGGPRRVRARCSRDSSARSHAGTSPPAIACGVVALGLVGGVAARPRGGREALGPEGRAPHASSHSSSCSSIARVLVARGYAGGDRSRSASVSRSSWLAYAAHVVAAARPVDGRRARRVRGASSLAYAPVSRDRPAAERRRRRRCT